MNKTLGFFFKDKHSIPTMSKAEIVSTVGAIGVVFILSWEVLTHIF
jgi:hypothetical protein